MSNVKKNLIWLSLVHCSNYIFPLVTLPYLVRILGPSNFGTLAIVQAVCQYLILVTEFGFNYTSTRDISLHRENKEKVTSIFFSTLLAKLLIFIVCIIVLFLTSFIFDFVDNLKYLIVVSLLGVMGSVMFPIWLFQGLERMAAISSLTTFAKLVVLAGTFMFVKSEEDIDIALLVNSLSLFIPGVLSLVYVFKCKMIIWRTPSIYEAISQLKKSFPLFVSSISTSLYTTLNTILMGWYCPAAVVGNYAAADKLRVAAQGLYSPVRQAVFPHAVALSSTENWMVLVAKRYGLPFIGLGFLMALSFIIIGPTIIRYYLGDNFVESGRFLFFMAPIPFIVAIATVFGHWIMIAGGYSKVLGKIYLVASLLHILYVIPMVQTLGANGMVFSVILTELFITMCMLCYVYRNRYKINVAKTS